MAGDSSHSCWGRTTLPFGWQASNYNKQCTHTACIAIHIVRNLRNSFVGPLSGPIICFIGRQGYSFFFFPLIYILLFFFYKTIFFHFNVCKITFCSFFLYKMTMTPSSPPKKNPTTTYIKIMITPYLRDSIFCLVIL